TAHSVASVLVLGLTFPSSQRRGGCAIKKMPRSHQSGADGVVSSAKCLGLKSFAELTTPSAPIKVASRNLIGVAATPPLRGGDCFRLKVSSEVRDLRRHDHSDGGNRSRSRTPRRGRTVHTVLRSLGRVSTSAAEDVGVYWQVPRPVAVHPHGVLSRSNESCRRFGQVRAGLPQQSRVRRAG